MRVPAFLLFQKPPEHSIPFRIATLASVLCGILAILHEEQWPPFSLLVIVATLAGSGWSYLRRATSNWLIKLFLSLIMLYALYDFLINLALTPYDPRVPLANLLLWLQTLHSFDLPARRDLNYSLVTGFILVSVAAVLSHDMTYLPFFAGFLLCALYTMIYNYQSDVSEKRRLVGNMPSFGTLSRLVASLAGGLLILGGAVFFVIPRYEGMKIRPLPMTIRLGVLKASRGEIRNPAYPNMAGRVRHAKRHFDPDSYYGFNAYLDLNLRGRLSDDVVMRVRSSDESYYRGLAFNQYNGEGWEIQDENLQQIIAPAPPIMLNIEGLGDKEIVQIFYVEKDMPNIIFSAYQLSQLFFPSDTVYVDSHGGVRTTFPLEAGMVYSAISRSYSPRPSVIRRLARRPHLLTNMERRAILLDLGLPSTVPARVKELASELTRGKVGAYEKAAAITTWLQAHYEYTLDIPPFGADKDVVDEFLFHYRKGYCEQFATALAVMCRSVGCPARLVTGYLPGTYNPFTGYYEVKSSDAHAWVEVMVERVGWVEFDPSPGYSGTPRLTDHARSAWVFDSIVKYLRDSMGIDTTNVGSVLWSMTAALLASVRQAGIAGWAALACTLAAVVTLFVLTILRVHRRLSSGAARPDRIRQLVQRLGDRAMELARRVVGQVVTVTPRDEVASAWHQMVDHLSVDGCTKTPSQTPREYAGKAALHLPKARPAIEQLTDEFQRARYSTQVAAEEQVQRARNALHSVVEAIRTNGRGTGGNGS